jgi:hypothetical protein
MSEDVEDVRCGDCTFHGGWDAFLPGEQYMAIYFCLSSMISKFQKLEMGILLKEEWK